MNTEEINACVFILNQIVKRPEARFFWDLGPSITSSMITHPLNFQIIRQRLNPKDLRYKSSRDFVEDMRLVFTNAKASNQNNSIRYAAAQQLENDFEEMILEINPASKTPMVEFQTKIAQFSSSSIYPTHTIPKNSGATPGSCLFETDPDPNDIQLLKRDIKFFTSSDMIFKLAAFVSRLQPEVVNLSDGFSMNLNLMTPETKVEVRRFVTNLLRAAAVGEIDPFARPFGNDIDPIKVREREDYCDLQ